MGNGAEPYWINFANCRLCLATNPRPRLTPVTVVNS